MNAASPTCEQLIAEIKKLRKQRDQYKQQFKSLMHDDRTEMDNEAKQPSRVDAAIAAANPYQSEMEYELPQMQRLLDKT